MACAGHSYEKIGDILGVSGHTVAAWKARSPSAKKVWADAVTAWPIFNHKLAAKPINAEELLQAYCVEKKSLTDILTEFGLPKTRVVRLLDYLGIDRRKDHIQVVQNTENLVDIQNIIKAYKKGASLKYLSKKWGISMNTVRSHLEKNGIRIRNVSEAKKASHKLNQKRSITHKRKLKTVANIMVAQILYKDLHNIQEIASALGLSKQAVHYYLKDPLWVTPLRHLEWDKGLGFVPYVRASELLQNELKGGENL